MAIGGGGFGGSLGAAEGAVVIDVGQAIQKLDLLERKINGLEGVGANSLNGLKKGGAQIDTLTVKAEKFEKQYGLAGKSLLGFGAITVGVLGAGLFAAMGFEKGMDAVSSSLGGVGTATGITADEFEKLSALALQIGKDTVFSASEAASAMEELAKQGQNTTQILGGSAEAAVNLASAIGVGIPDAAAGVATAMNIFRSQNLSAADSADILTAAVNSSATDLTDFQAGLRNVGPIAASLGLTFQETAAGIAYFTNFGLKGADAGVSMARALDNLSKPTSEASLLMEKLGISAFDAAGEFVGFPSLMEQMNKSMADATDQEKLFALQTIFGAEAADIMGIAVLEGSEGLEAMEDQLEPTGQAAEQAAQRMDNLAGDVENLKGSLETAGIIIGQKFIPLARSLTQAVTKVISVFLDLPDPLKNAGIAMIAVTGAIAGLAGGAIVAAPMIMRMAESFKAIGGFGRIAQGFNLVSKAMRGILLANPWILALAAAIGLLYLAYRTNFLGFGDGIRKIGAAISDVFEKISFQVQEVIRIFNLLRSGGLNPVSSAFIALGNVLKRIGLGKVGSALGEFGRNIDTARIYFDQFLETGRLSSTLLKNLPTPIRSVVRVLAAFANLFDDLQASFNRGKFLRDLPKNFRVMSREIGKVLENVTGIKGLGETFAKMGETVGKAIQGILGFVLKLIDAFKNAREQGMNPLKAAFTALGSVIPPLAGLFAALENQMENVGRMFLLVLDTVRQVVQGFSEDGLSGALDALKGQVPKLLAAFQDLIQGVLRIWGELGKLLVSAVRAVDWGAVLEKLGDLAGSLLSWVANAVAGIPWGSIVDGAKDLAGRAISLAGDLAGKVAGWIGDAVAAVDWGRLISGALDLSIRALSLMGSLVAQVATWFGSAVSGVDWSRLISGAANLAGRAISLAGSLAGKMISWIGDAVSGIDWSRLIQGATDLASRALTLMGSLAVKAGEWLQGAVSGIDWGTLIEGASGLAGKALEKMGDLADLVLGWFQNAVNCFSWESVTAGAEDLSGKAMQKAGSLCDAAIEWIGEAVAGIDWDLIIGGAKDLAERAIKNMGSLAQAVATWVGEVLDSINWDSVFDSVTSAFESISEAISGILEAVETVGGGIGTGVQTIIDVFNGMIDIVSTVLDPVITALETIESTAGKVGDAIGKIPFVGGDGGGGESGSTGDPSGANFLADSMEAAQTRIETAAQGIANVNAALSTGIGTVVTDYEDMPVEVNSALLTLVQNVSDRFNDTRVDAGTWVTEMTAFGKAAGEGIRDSADTPWSEIPGKFQKHIDSISSKAGLWVASMKAFGTAGGDGFADNAEVGFDASEDRFQDSSDGILGTAGSLVGSLGKAGASAGSSFASGISEGMDRAIGAVSNAASTIRARMNIGSQYQVGYGIGSSLGEGIYNGMAAWAGRIAGEAASIVRGGVDAANREADARSPSRKMILLGENMGEGLRIGLERSGDSVARAMGALVPSGSGMVGSFSARAGSPSSPVTYIQVNALRSEELVELLQGNEMTVGFVQSFNAEMGIQ